MTLTFTIDRDDISPERLEEYKKALNALVGYDAEWELVRADNKKARRPKPAGQVSQGE